MEPVRGDLSRRPGSDECYATAMEEVLALERRLATPRPLKEGVDGALEAENERRIRPMLLLEEGDEDNEESGHEEHMQPPLTEVEVQKAATGEEACHGTESEVQETGASEEEGRPLAAFIEQITARIQDTILGSPPPASARAPRGAATPVHRSARLALGPNVGVPIETVAREAVARRLGSLPPSATFTERL